MSTLYLQERRWILSCCLASQMYICNISSVKEKTAKRPLL